MVEQLDLLAPPVTEPTASVHRGGTTTERSAARSAARRSGGHKARILAHLVRVGEHGATPYELHAATGGAGPWVCSTRCLDLMKRGWVARTGQTRKTPNGEDALLWFATDAGRVASELERNE